MPSQYRIIYDSIYDSITVFWGFVRLIEINKNFKHF
jgi:hypothetical protein